jgi:uncharacterized protein YcsI (UPF0317 family)
MHAAPIRTTLRGYRRCNFAILPERNALAFLRFCQHNQKRFPIVSVSDSGVSTMLSLGHGIDIYTDIQKYRVTHASDYRTHDLVTVALSFALTFENALVRSGIPLRHIEGGRTVPMYRSFINLTHMCKFAKQMVVAMRHISAHQAAKTTQTCLRHPRALRASFIVGDPAQFGLTDLSQSYWARRPRSGRAKCRSIGPAV